MKLVPRLELRSALPWADGEVTLVTQCSEDRLHNLAVQTETWRGLISAAVLLWPSDGSGDSVQKRLASVRNVHAAAEASRGCRVSIVVFEAVVAVGAEPSFVRAHYPINALRNEALARAATELVFLCDVDLVPCSGAAEALLAASPALLHQCRNLRTALVVPAIELEPAETPDDGADSAAAAAKDDDDDDYESPLRIRDDARRAEVVRVASVGKPAAAEALRRSGEKKNNQSERRETKAVPFASSVFPPGHRATRTCERWVDALTPYEAVYEEGYEPYVVVARSLCPWYDARFTGYGRNKIVHILALAANGWRFVGEVPGVHTGRKERDPVDAIGN